jgi:hypothetical protein
MTAKIGDFIPDRLIIDEVENTDEVYLTTGQNLKRGSVLGKIKYTCPTTGTAGSNTGNGTVTIVKPGEFCKQGTYTITASLAVTLTTQNAVVFSVTNPDGKYLGSCAVGGTTSDVAAFGSPEISFLITNGSTDFADADSFTIAVTGYIVTTGSLSASGTANGTAIQVAAGRSAAVGAYLATCTAIEATGIPATFSVTDPDGAVIGTAYASKKKNGSGAITGNGTITEFKPGVLFKNTGRYTVKVTDVTGANITFSVYDPDGTLLGTCIVTNGTSDYVVFWHNQISFKITNGSSDFVADDEFDVAPFQSQQISFVIWTGSNVFALTDYFTFTMAKAHQEAKLVDSDNVDGSQLPFGILAQDTDATAGRVKAPVYTGGCFNENALYFGGNDTIEDHRLYLRKLDIYTRPSVPAGNEP